MNSVQATVNGRLSCRWAATWQILLMGASACHRRTVSVNPVSSGPYTKRGMFIMRVHAVLAAAIGVLLLAGCSSAADSTSADASASASAELASSASATASPEPTFEATVPPEVAEQLDASDGQIIIPGEIDSSKQDLAAECTAAVAPVRAIMAKSKSGFDVQGADKSALLTELNKARATCETASPQEWANFYNLEFAGWLYEKVE